MIRNSHQLRSARRARDTLRAALEAASDSDKLTYRELIADVQHEIDEYVGIVDGYLVDFEVSSIDGLADALIKARISTGMSQRRLADALGVSEQMVQKDEAGGYERASLTRLADVADALGFTLAGRLAPADQAAPPIAGAVAAFTIVSAYPLASMFAAGQAAYAQGPRIFGAFQAPATIWTSMAVPSAPPSTLTDVVTTLRSQDVA